MLELHICDRFGRLLRCFALGDSTEFIVGRDEACDIRIASRAVSREHCCIEQTGHDMVLRDLGSTGGTFVNGNRVDAVTIHDGIQVQVGPAVLKFIATEI